MSSLKLATNSGLRGFILASVLIAGCGEPTDPRIAQWREKLVTTEAPDNALSIADVSELLSQSGASPTADKPASAAEPSVTDKPSATETAPPAEAAPQSETVADAPTREVALVGRISAGELEPWEPGKASFIISELPSDGHGQGHDADNCPFCKRRAAGLPTTVVRFVDEQQQTIAIDAQQLLGVKKDQHVIVHGIARSPEPKMIEIIADRIYLFPK